MPEWWITYVGPIAPIIGATFGALIGAAVTYVLVQKRKRVIFFAGKSESLTESLKARTGEIAKVTINKQELNSLNRAEVHAFNSGNTSIANFSFEILIPGLHQFVQPSLNASSLLLQTDVLIKVSSVEQYSSIKLTAPFLNPKERLEVAVFFDGKLVEPEVMCRIEDVRCKVRRGLSIDSYLEDFGPNTILGAIGRGVIKGLIR
ncbi:hypothetical protein ACQR1V_26890 [Bradyrhizobium oligotrophicum]|uniref:hypothetical protein n=1 Tax=Bradyrhizobium oligotrophicum TaxID=44255 RepID=UPI003EB79B8B